MTDASPHDIENAAKDLRDALVLVEWSRVETVDGAPVRRCPACGWAKTQGHAPACRVRSALSKARATLPEHEEHDDEPAIQSVLPRWARAPARYAIWLMWLLECAIGLAQEELPYGLGIALLIACCVTVAFYWQIVGREPRPLASMNSEGTTR